MSPEVGGVKSATGHVRMLIVAMQMSTDPAESPARRALDPVEVPLHPGVVTRMRTAIEAALDDGPALLPLPTHRSVRAALLDEFRPAEPLESDAAFVVPTSGSTGRPKGVLLSASAVRAAANATHERLGGPGRWLLTVPATHIAGLMVLVRSVVARTEPVAVDLTHGFDPDLFAAASVRLFASGTRHYTAVVPRQLATLLDHGGAAVDALTGYDAVLVGGGAAGDELLARARAAGAAVVSTYGMTETCGGCVYDGVALPGTQIEISDGRVRLAGPMLATGYRLRPDLSDAFADGWFTTADLGHIDETGRLVVTGRVDDVAVSGGVNVPLAGVDAIVVAHPDVREALSIAVPDDEWGHRVVTAVVAADPTHPPALDSVRDHVRGQAPAAYAPKELVVVDALPALPGGKPDRRGLAAQLGYGPVVTTR